MSAAAETTGRPLIRSCELPQVLNDSLTRMHEPTGTCPRWCFMYNPQPDTLAPRYTFERQMVSQLIV